MTSTEFQKPPKRRHRIGQVWESLTQPQAKDEDHARSEYMTKVIILICCLVAFPFLILSIIGWLTHQIPMDTAIILGVMTVLFIVAWLITNSGRWKIGGLIPCLLIFASAIYGNYVGGIDAPAMLLYAFAIVLSAIMLDYRVQMGFMVASLLGYLGLGLAHYLGILSTARNAETMFINRVSITVSVMTAISLGVWFLKHQYQKSLNQERDTAKKTRTLLETIVDGIVFSDLEGYIMDCNEAALKMFKINDKNQVLGKSIGEFLSPDYYPQADQLRDALLESHSTGTITCKGVLPNGDSVYMEINSAIYFDSYSHPKGFVSSIRDVTQRKKDELELKKYQQQLEILVSERTQELEEANKELESFSYSISHDLRSPLRGINGYISLLGDDEASQLSQTSKSYIHRIKESSKFMADLISDLLDFSRLIRQPVSRKLVDMQLLAKEVKEQLTSSDYSGKEVDFVFENLPACEADPVLVRQVIFNLMDNAIKYSQKQQKSVIRMGASQNDKMETVYFIQDNGIGFDQKTAPNLFGVFQRLHNNAEYEGTGIGLATVQRIVQRHNGRIWVESAVNQGTTFFFTLNSAS